MALEPPASYSASLSPSISPEPSILTPPSTIATTTTDSGNAFIFPPHYHFPPFFTLQPNATTRASQLANWSSLIQRYCAHHRFFTLDLTSITSNTNPAAPLFHNAVLRRNLSTRDAYFVLAWMSSAEGGRRAEFVDSAAQARAAKVDFSAVPSGIGGSGETGGRVYVYWRRPEEWAEVLAGWVEATGQKGGVLTLYELTQGEGVRDEEWRGMDAELLRKSLQVLVRKGRAQVFGQGEELGVKFS